MPNPKMMIVVVAVIAIDILMLGGWFVFSSLQERSALTKKPAKIMTVDRENAVRQLEPSLSSMERKQVVRQLGDPDATRTAGKKAEDGWIVSTKPAGDKLSVHWFWIEFVDGRVKSFVHEQVN